MSRRRTKIKYSYEDYIKTLSPEELQSYNKSLAPLIRIIMSGAADREVLEQAKTYDSEHGTDMFGSAVKFASYCIACSKFDCDC